MPEPGRKKNRHMVNVLGFVVMISMVDAYQWWGLLKNGIAYKFGGTDIAQLWTKKNKAIGSSVDHP